MHMIALLEPFVVIARVVILVIIMFDKEQVQSVVLYVVKRCLTNEETKALMVYPLIKC